MTSRDSRTAGGPERLLQVHPGFLEELGQILRAVVLSRGIQERREGDVYGFGEMSRENI